MSVRDDQLIFGYLSQVADAAHGRLPSLARQDLVEKVRHEIDERRRRAGNADITRVLQSMGDPRAVVDRAVQLGGGEYAGYRPPITTVSATQSDRKSTRLNSSHLGISYAVFCLKKKKKT